MTRRYVQIRERFADVFGTVLDAAGPESDALREASSALLDSHARLAATVQQAPPVLQVRSDVLCVPVLGELDAARTARLQDAVVSLALARGVGLVVLDLTGTVGGEELALHLGGVFAALERLGLRGALSGVGQEVAAALAVHPDALSGVRCFAELGSALAALPPRRRT